MELRHFRYFIAVAEESSLGGGLLTGFMSRSPH
jgi:DNA-binding transcriptional LysR family regulator